MLQVKVKDGIKRSGGKEITIIVGQTTKQACHFVDVVIQCLRTFDERNVHRSEC